MKYVLWARKRQPEALWFEMPYAARDYAGCVHLVDYYESEWPDHYDYEIHTANVNGIGATYPKGMRVPFC